MSICILLAGECQVENDTKNEIKLNEHYFPDRVYIWVYKSIVCRFCYCIQDWGETKAAVVYKYREKDNLNLF